MCADSGMERSIICTLLDEEVKQINSLHSCFIAVVDIHVHFITKEIKNRKTGRRFYPVSVRHLLICTIVSAMTLYAPTSPILIQPENKEHT